MMTKTRKAIIAVIVAAVAAGGWVAADLWRPITSDLRDFDPEVVARLDTEMWRSYYAKERVRLFNQLAYLLRQQYHMPMARSYVVALRAAKAAFIFKDGNGRADYEQALPDLVAYYQAIRNVSKTPFDVHRTAALELEWWIVHRERHQHATGDLDQALANLAAELYQLPAEKFLEHGRYRAEAMAIRDKAADRGGVSEVEWRKIHDLLRHSWSSLWIAVQPIKSSTLNVRLVYLPPACFAAASISAWVSMPEQLSSMI